MALRFLHLGGAALFKFHVFLILALAVVAAAGVGVTHEAHATAPVNIRELHLKVNDLVYDEVTGKIYLTTRADDDTYPNRLVTLNPFTSAVEGSVSLGPNPNRLALAGNSAYLYVGIDDDNHVTRVTLPSLTPDLTFGLGTGVCGDPVMGDGVVVPGDGRSIVISRFDASCRKTIGLTVYDDGVPRPLQTDDSLRRESIALSVDGSLVYGADTGDTAGILSTHSVSSGGVALTNARAGAIDTFSNEIKWHEELLYTSDGRVIDPGDLSTITRILVQYHYNRLLPDGSKHLVIFLTSDAYQDFKIQEFESPTYTLVNEFPVPNAAEYPTRLIAWGRNGLAFATALDQLFLIDGLSVFLDMDGDNVIDPNDNCPMQINPGQEDQDRNGVGDACDGIAVGGAVQMTVGAKDRPGWVSFIAGGFLLAAAVLAAHVSWTRRARHPR